MDPQPTYYEAAVKRLGMRDSDIPEVCGWRSIEMLRRYTAEVPAERAHAAHRRYSPGDALRVRWGLWQLVCFLRGRGRGEPA